MTVECASVMKVGSVMPASFRKSVTYPARRAESFAKTNRGWSAPTEVQLLYKHTHNESITYNINFEANTYQSVAPSHITNSNF